MSPDPIPVEADEVVEAERSTRAWRTEIPNMVIDDPALTHYERALYLHYKRVCGDGRACFQGRKALVEKTGIDYDRLLAARGRLADQGYIRVEHQAGKPTHVWIVDVWGENVARYGGHRRGRTTHQENLTGAHQENPTPPVGKTRRDPSGKPDTKKIPLRRSLEEDRSRAGSETSMIGQLGGRLEAIGMRPESVDQLFELLESKGYPPADFEWIVDQGEQRRVKALAYYREIVATNPPGITDRLEAARRLRRRGPAAPPPRGASHDGMPKAPPAPFQVTGAPNA